MTEAASPAIDERAHSDVWARVATERAARGALAVVALHVADDSFLQPNAGVSATDHLLGGLLLLLPLVAAIAFYPRLRAGARAVVALLGGYFGVLGGIEAIHYSREVGPSGDDYTGLLSIPAGLVLIGVGIGTLWRSRKGGRLWWRYTRRLLIAAATVVVAAFVLFTTAFAYVITHAARPFVPVADLGAPYEEVEFRTSDGLLLKGWYIESHNRAAVISFPGRAGSQSRAKMMAEHGYGVLLFDRRGEGESEGDPNLLGWQGERDIHAAVRFLQSRPDVDPQRIGGIGLSVGGEMMIEAAAESSALKAIMSEGASARSVRDTWANGGSSWDNLIGTGFFTAAASVFSGNLPPADLKSLVPKMSAAAFFVYGEEGQPEEEPANKGFFEEATGYKKIWEVPGSGHMKGIEAQPEEYERRVIGFFDEHLRAEP